MNPLRDWLQTRKALTLLILIYSLSQVDELTIEDELKVGVTPEDDDVYASLHQLTNAQNIQL